MKSFKPRRKRDETEEMFFYREVEAYFQALSTLEVTLYLLPPEAVSPMDKALKLVRVAEARLQHQVFNDQARMALLNERKPRKKSSSSRRKNIDAETAFHINQVEAHFKALATIEGTLHLVPSEAVSLLRSALKLVRAAEVRRRRNVLKGYATMSRFKLQGREARHDS